AGDDYADDYPADDYADDDYPAAPGGDYDGGPPTMAAEFDGGPPTAGYPAPMPFAPGGRKDGPLDDDLSEDEAEFDQPAYPGGSPDFDGEDYAYDHQGDYDDDYEDEAPARAAAPAPAEEPASTASPGKQWFTLAIQLALGVIGGAAVWLGFN